MSTPIHTAILHLLHEHDCVILPSLGAFITRRRPSAYDERRGLMTPPSKEVAFNPDIRHSDALLADYIATTDKVDFSVAQLAVEDFVSGTRRRLDNSESVMLPELGSLLLIDGRVVFEPVQGLNVLIDSYGLSPVPAQPVRVSRVGKSIVAESRKVAASAIAVVALFCVSQRTADPDFQRADISSLLAPATTVLSAVPEVVTPSAPVESVETQQEQFCVIVASFLTRQEAQDYIASMRARGVDDLSVLEGGGRCRVIAGSFESEDAAKSAARQVRSVKGFEKAWILHVQ